MSLWTSVRREIWVVDPNIAFDNDSGTVAGDLHRYGYAKPEFDLAAMSIFAGIGLAACVAPSRSAMRVAPLIAPRYE